MAQFEVRVSGSFAALAKETRKKLSQVVRKAAFDIEAQAKANAPVDTGALRNSIQAETTGELEGEVGVGVEYGPYVEFGTVKTAPQPFLGPAVDAVQPAFEKAVAAVIARAGE